MRLAALAAALLLPVAAPAQQAVDIGTGAVLRGLDKVDGQTTDFELDQGGAAEIGAPSRQRARSWPSSSAEG